MKTLALLLVVSACAPTELAATIEAPANDLSRPQLARFMREMVNVPFSFAVLEHKGRNRPQRFQRAAVVLGDAVRDLVHWETPPVPTESAREVFYTYARQLELQVDRFQVAAHAHDTAEVARHLEAIRQTCNSCHRFFRPASAISSDVYVDRFVEELGGTP